ncbi:unnamed protein product, partial [Prorocentrum cordatum]
CVHPTALASPQGVGEHRPRSGTTQTFRLGPQGTRGAEKLRTAPRWNGARPDRTAADGTWSRPSAPCAGCGPCPPRACTKRWRDARPCWARAARPPSRGRWVRPEPCWTSWPARGWTSEGIKICAAGGLRRPGFLFALPARAASRGRHAARGLLPPGRREADCGGVAVGRGRAVGVRHAPGRRTARAAAQRAAAAGAWAAAALVALSDRLAREGAAGGARAGLQAAVGGRGARCCRLPVAAPGPRQAVRLPRRSAVQAGAAFPGRARGLCRPEVPRRGRECRLQDNLSRPRARGVRRAVQGPRQGAILPGSPGDSAAPHGGAVGLSPRPLAWAPARSSPAARAPPRRAPRAAVRGRALAARGGRAEELAPARVRAEAVVLPCGGRAAGHCPAPGGRGRAAPPRAAERRAWHGARPLGRGAVGARCMLMPLLCSSTIVPDGVWHCTYNVHVDAEPFTIGVGGMGACASDLQVLAAEGDVAGLEEASLQGAPEAAEAAAIARIAVEQSHLQVLEWAHRRCGDGLLRSRFENGVSLLHLAAGAGEAGVARWLLQRGAEVDAPDASGATAAHWVQLSGSAECLAELHAWGADVEAADLRGGCRPLHYLAGKGHADAARWAVRRAGADAGAKDRLGRRPEAWAAAMGHPELSRWLQRHRWAAQARPLRGPALLGLGCVALCVAGGVPLPWPLRRTGGAADASCAVG